jgi:hypothetical protein
MLFIINNCRFTSWQVQYYEHSLKTYSDFKNYLDTAKKEGLQESIEKGIEKCRKEGRVEVVKNLLRDISSSVICSFKLLILNHWASQRS